MSQRGDGCGVVDWSVIETVSGNELGGGQIEVCPTDVEVDEHRNSDNVTYYRKRIRLFGPFSFSIDEHPTGSPGAS